MKVGDLVRSLQEWREGAFGIVIRQYEESLWSVAWVDTNDNGKEFLYGGEWHSGSLCRSNHIEVVR